MKPCYDINFYDLRLTDKNQRHMTEYMIDRTMIMFKWDGLPSTIPYRSLELFFQTQGFVLGKEHEGKVYVYYGGLGGKPDQVYRPTIATIANPAQRFDGQFPIIWEVTEDSPKNGAVIGLNDPLLKGLLPIHEKYASQIADNELTIWMTDILTRAPWLLSAEDGQTKAEAQQFIDDIFAGKLSAVQSEAFFEHLKADMLSNGNHQSLGALMQLHQYYKAGWFNELGLNAMQNQFKKEAISDSEQQMNKDVLTPLCDAMLKCRKEWAENMNEYFADILEDEITVDYDSAWFDNEIEEKAIIMDMVNNDDIENNSSNNNDDNVPDGDNNSDVSDDILSGDDRGEVTGDGTEEQTTEEGNGTEESSDVETGNIDEIEEKLDDIEEKLDEVLDEIEDDKEGEDEQEQE